MVRPMPPLKATLPWMLCAMWGCVDAHTAPDDTRVASTPDGRGTQGGDQDRDVDGADAASRPAPTPTPSPAPPPEPDPAPSCEPGARYCDGCLCEGVELGVATLETCCTEAGLCGLDVAPLATLGAPLQGCVEREALGDTDDRCSVAFDEADGVADGGWTVSVAGAPAVLTGCCRPNGQCGVDISQVEVQGLGTFEVGAGCTDIRALAEGSRPPAVRCDGCPTEPPLAEVTTCTSADGPRNECAGRYCDATQCQLLQSSNRGACSNRGDLVLVCEGVMWSVMSQCARASALSPEGDLSVERCAYDNALPEGASEPCVACYVEATVCARNECSGQCIAGDGLECDLCMQEAGCFALLDRCSGLPRVTL